MPHHHHAQLLVCHEHIGERAEDKQGRYEYCNLPAFAWCFDEDLYVCEMHLATRHEFHHTRTVTDEREDDSADRNAPDSGERRHGERRK